jgi:hypothetical protein
MLGTQPLQLALSPGTGVDFWHPRMLGRRFPLVASIIEILPENHADLALDCNQRKGLSYYDRQ